jgi:hypothetical protein
MLLTGWVVPTAKVTQVGGAAAISIEAAYDSLVIVDRLTPIAGGATLGEIHAFAYLACLLSLFERKPAADWGYEFTALPPTLPYAPSVTDAIKILEMASFLRRSDGIYSLTKAGSQDCMVWSGLGQLSWRKRYLEGATGASLVTGVPAVANDLSNEPQLQRAAEMGGPRELLEEATLIPLFEQFTALRQAAGGDVEDMLTPAAVYLAFLSSQSS